MIGRASTTAPRARQTPAAFARILGALPCQRHRWASRNAPHGTRPSEARIGTILTGGGCGGSSIVQTAPNDTLAALRDEPDAARLGNPSFVWRSGQQRRLAIIERYVSLEGKRVLDLGCGVGEYVRAFARRGARALGCDIELARLVEARRRGTVDVLAGCGEALPLRDGSLDVAVLNEVIEHVTDERATLREVGRVLAPDGICVIFAPNRLYPFETHGIYLRGRYRFGNIPLVNWLPRALRDRLVPHARVYAHGDWTRLVDGTGLTIVDHTHVYPGFDNVATRRPGLARLLRAVCYRAEGTPLSRFGLSHLVVLRKVVPRREEAA